MINDLNDKKMKLSERIENMVKVAGLDILVSEESKRYIAYFDKLDNEEKDQEWERLANEQDELHKQITNKITSQLPVEVREEALIRNLTAYAIEANAQTP